jgi:hypothetical protein
MGPWGYIAMEIINVDIFTNVSFSLPEASDTRVQTFFSSFRENLKGHSLETSLLD